jgi:two-component system KDP operon response regulator KdpE
MTTRTTLVLVVDVDDSVTEFARRELQRHDMRVVVAASGEHALRLAQQQRPDLVVLALDLPDMPGLEVLRRLRANGSLPAILLAERSGPSNRSGTRGRESLTKPFTGPELVARVAEALGRPPGRADRIVAGDIEIDLEHRIAKQAGHELALTRTEWALLAHLATHKGRTLPGGDILSSVWGPEYRDDLQFLRVWISRLRAKLGGKGFMIETVRGVGYVFQPEEPAQPRRRASPVGRR